MSALRARFAALAAGFVVMQGAGPYDIDLLPSPVAAGAAGTARLFAPESPFGIGVTDDGRAVYQIRITASHLPRFPAFIAWATSPDLGEWVRLGVVREGTSVVGPVAMNKFLLVITGERDSSVATHTGPTVLHGTSPSGWLQSFLTHPLFRGIPQ
ncbi:MAG: hypothetical protein ABI637_07590 [Gemmatimonadota bacterium]